MATLMEKDSLINGISQTLGLIVAQTGGRNEDSELLAGLRNKLYALKPEEIDYEELSKLVREKFNKYKFLIFNIFEVFSLIMLIEIYGSINYNRQNDFIFPIIIGLIITIFSYEIGFISKILRKVSKLGKLGYSIYLVHPFFIQIFKYKGLSNIYFYLGIVVLVSFLFYYFIEKRIIDLKYYLLSKAYI